MTVETTSVKREVNLLSAETFSAKEALKLLRRQPIKYIRGVLGVYALSLAGCELGSTARASYFLMRYIDDILDGDRSTSGNPIEEVLDLRTQIETDFFGDSEISGLAQHAVRSLEKRGGKGDNPRGDFLNAVDAMIFDHERAKERRVLSNSQIEEYYWKLFSPLVNLMLIGLGSRLRTEDIPSLSYGQGRVYSIRDLKQDWTNGLLNVPGEILREAHLSSSSTHEEVKQSPVVASWFQVSLGRTREELKELQERLKSNPEAITNKMCNGLINPLIRFTNNFLREAA